MNIVDQYARDGYLSPVSVVPASVAQACRDTLEAIELVHGSLHYLYKLHTFMAFPRRLATAPALVDVVEQLIGPNILLHNTTLITKEAHSDSHVSWHQDLTYWGLNSDAQVSAWVALSPATLQSGCMQMIPGSHKQGQLHHINTEDSSNVLLNGQTVTDVDTGKAVALELSPGQASLHHGWTLHKSAPNRSDERRIGLNIQYFSTEVRNLKSDKDSALLVRGKDEYSHFRKDRIAAGEFNVEAMIRQKALSDHIKSITLSQQ